MDESSLIARLADNDQQAFDCIYRMYSCRLITYCRAYIKCREDIEELVQDVFMSLWNNRSKIKNTGTLKPLLFKSTRNRIINYYRAALNELTYQDYRGVDNYRVTEDCLQEIEYKEFRETVIQQIALLPDTQRKAVMLSKIQGRSNEEIAAMMGINVQSVKNAIHMGLKKLRRSLGSQGGMIGLLSLICELTDIIH